jgi:hypothetical protein
VRTAALFHPGEQYRISVSSPLTDTAYVLRADADGRLEVTGRMAGAMHDPIVPGRRTRHFRAFGSDAVTTVAIAAVAEGGEAAGGTAAATSSSSYDGNRETRQSSPVDR